MNLFRYMAPPVLLTLAALGVGCSGGSSPANYVNTDRITTPTVRYEQDATSRVSREPAPPTPYTIQEITDDGYLYTRTINGNMEIRESEPIPLDRTSCHTDAVVHYITSQTGDQFYINEVVKDLETVPDPIQRQL